MSEVETSQPEEVRGKTKPTGWDRTRLGVLVPLGVVVAVAIVCIVVAALTSARRADEVAVAREQELLTRAIVNHAEWSLRRLGIAVSSNVAVSAGDIDQVPDLVQPRLTAWLGPLADHSLVIVVNSKGRTVYSQFGRQRSAGELTEAAIPALESIVEHLRGNAGVPAGAARLPTTTQRNMPGSIFLQIIEGRLCVVTAVPVTTGSRGNGPSPVALSVRTLEQTALGNIGSRLQLRNLRVVGPGEAPEDDHTYEIAGDNGQPIGRFAWTPQKPGAAILDSVIPFIGIALAGFTLLAGLVLRYMRTTAATIAAGENRLRYLALHDPLCGLPNRNFFGERLETVIAEVQRGGRPAAVLYIDLDHFKDVNDTLGHPIGDELIRASRCGCRARCRATTWWRGSAATSSPSSRPPPPTRLRSSDRQPHHRQALHALSITDTPWSSGRASASPSSINAPAAPTTSCATPT